MKHKKEFQRCLIYAVYLFLKYENRQMDSRELCHKFREEFDFDVGNRTLTRYLKGCDWFSKTKDGYNMRHVFCMKLGLYERAREQLNSGIFKLGYISVSKSLEKLLGEP